MLKNLMDKKMEEKMIRLRAEAIVTGKTRKMVMPSNFMNEKKCSFIKEVMVTPRKVSKTGEVKPNLNPDWNVIQFYPNGDVTLTVINKNEFVLGTFNGIKMPKYKSSVYSVSL